MTRARPHPVPAELRLTRLTVSTRDGAARRSVERWLTAAALIVGTLASPAHPAPPSRETANVGAQGAVPEQQSTKQKVSPFVLASRAHAQDAKGKPQAVSPLTMQRSHRSASQQARK